MTPAGKIAASIVAAAVIVAGSGIAYIEWNKREAAHALHEFNRDSEAAMREFDQIGDRMARQRREAQQTAARQAQLREVARQLRDDERCVGGFVVRYVAGSPPAYTQIVDAYRKPVHCVGRSRL